MARHSKWNMAKVFKQFDFDGDGQLTMGEFKRAFRALGLKKRDGSKMDIDEKMFKSFGECGGPSPAPDHLGQTLDGAVSSAGC